MNRLEEVQREHQELYCTLERLTQGEMEFNGYPPWPQGQADMTFSHAPLAAPDITFSHAPPAPDAAFPYAPPTDTGSPTADVGAQLPEDNHGTMSCIPVTMDDLVVIEHNGTVPQRYRCPSPCGSEMDKSGVKRHLKSKKHLPPQFPCVCGKRFTRNDTLKPHKRKCREAQNALST